MSPEIQPYIDQVIKTLALKEGINSLKVLINDQNQSDPEVFFEKATVFLVVFKKMEITCVATYFWY